MFTFLSLFFFCVLDVVLSCHEREREGEGGREEEEEGIASTAKGYRVSGHTAPVSNTKQRERDTQSRARLRRSS